MKSHKIFINKKGFTLIELLVTISLGTLLLLTASFISINAFTRSTIESTEKEIVMTILSLRNGALVNKNGLGEGIHFDHDSYTLFQGEYKNNAPENIKVQISSGVTLGGIDEILFSPVQAQSNASGTLNIQSEKEERKINITHDGTVTW